MKLLRAAWDSEVMVPFVYPVKVVIGVVGLVVLGLISQFLIMSACLKSMNCSFVRERRSSIWSSKKAICQFCTHQGSEHSDFVHDADLRTLLRPSALNSL